MKITQNRPVIDNRVVKKIFIDKDEEIEHLYESVRLYSYDEMKGMSIKSGVKILKEFGDFEESDYKNGN